MIRAAAKKASNKENHNFFIRKAFNIKTYIHYNICMFLWQAHFAYKNLAYCVRIMYTYQN